MPPDRFVQLARRAHVQHAPAGQEGGAGLFVVGELANILDTLQLARRLVDRRKHITDLDVARSIAANTSPTLTSPFNDRAPERGEQLLSIQIIRNSSGARARGLARLIHRQAAVVAHGGVAA